MDKLPGEVVPVVGDKSSSAPGVAAEPLHDGLSAVVGDDEVVASDIGEGGEDLRDEPSGRIHDVEV